MTRSPLIDAGYARRSPEHEAAIVELAEAGHTISEIARLLVARGLPALSRSSVSRYLGRLHREQFGAALDAIPSDASDEERDDAETIAYADKASQALLPGYPFDAEDALAERKALARRLKEIVNSPKAPASVAVRAASDLSRLLDAIQRAERSREHFLAELDRRDPIEGADT